MSEVSILSAQCEALNNTVAKVNNAIIAFKKQILLTGDYAASSPVQLEEGELEDAVIELNKFFDILLLLKEPHAIANQLLPNDAAEKLLNRVIAVKPGFFDQIQKIKTCMANFELLNNEQLDLLDTIVETLDNERTELFRNLRKARG